MFIVSQVNCICSLCIKEVFPFSNIDDNEIADLVICKPAVEDLSKIVFNPFDLNDINDLTPISHIDPDKQYFNTVTERGNSLYYNEESFNDRCTSLGNPKHNISVIHLNIRSVHKNLNNFECYLRNFSHQFKVIGLSETWNNEFNVDMCEIKCYNSEHLYRSNRKGGGVSVFIINCLKYTVSSDLSVINNIIKILFIEIKKEQFGAHKDMIIGVVYMPPKIAIDLFIGELLRIFNSLSKENKYVVLMGDYNVNLLNVESHNMTAEFIEMIYSFSMLPVINRPTRVQGNSVSLIDNIYCNNSTFDNLVYVVVFYQLIYRIILQYSLYFHFEEL